MNWNCGWPWPPAGPALNRGFTWFILKLVGGLRLSDGKIRLLPASQGRERFQIGTLIHHQSKTAISLPRISQEEALETSTTYYNLKFSPHPCRPLNRSNLPDKVLPGVLSRGVGDVEAPGCG